MLSLQCGAVLGVIIDFVGVFFLLFSMLNSVFHERVFSTCKTVMGSNQARLTMEHMEKKALLCQNADLIRKKII